MITRRALIELVTARPCICFAVIGVATNVIGVATNVIGVATNVIGVAIFTVYADLGVYAAYCCICAGEHQLIGLRQIFENVRQYIAELGDIHLFGMIKKIYKFQIVFFSIEDISLFFCIF
jgi:hypothetical protein